MRGLIARGFGRNRRRNRRAARDGGGRVGGDVLIAPQEGTRAGGDTGPYTPHRPALHYRIISCFGEWVMSMQPPSVSMMTSSMRTPNFPGR